MDIIRKSKYFKKIAKVYPPDVAIVIITYLLEKRLVRKTSWSYNGVQRPLSIISGKMVFSSPEQKTYDINGNKTESKFELPSFCCCVEDERNFYIVNNFDQYITVCDKTTGKCFHIVVPDSEIYGFCGITLTGGIAYIVSGYKIMHRYNTSGLFMPKWETEYDAWFVKTYNEHIYVGSDYHIFRYNSEGVSKKILWTGSRIYDFVIHDDRIYVCGLENVRVYDMNGKCVRKILAEHPRQIFALNNDIIIRTYNYKIIVYTLKPLLNC